MKTWREFAAPLIAAVIAANVGKTTKEVKAALRDAYPWGPRENHPYKIWCSEVNRQLHPKPAKVKDVTIWKSCGSEHLVSSPGQRSLLGEQE